MEQIARSSTSVISFSCDLATLLYLDDYAREKGYLTRSQVIRYHLKMGKAYIKIVERQMKEAEEDVPGA